jgi:beta-lactamase regulating signal transducer with metallopeptidase domain
MTHAMLGNAAVAALLAVLALAIGLTCRSAAVRHVAWVLVLLKLVSPPVLQVPLYVLPASWQTAEADGESARGLAWWDRYRVGEVVQWACAAWAVGAAGWFVWQGRRVVRFRRRVAAAEDPGVEVTKAARQIALAFGIARPPAVKAVHGICSPMLWGWGQGAVVLFPHELLTRLAPEARDTLLAHELAHYLRRDHWVRVLEFITTGLYWWHPAVWLARAGIEEAEEECCDAWVVGGLAASPRRYAEALLATVDFGAEQRRPRLPPGACAANRGARFLHRRLVGIIQARRPSRIRGAAALRTAALLFLLIQPVLRAATKESEVEHREGGDTRPPLTPEYRPWTPSPRTLPPPKPAEPPAWAAAPAPGGVLTAEARDHEVVLRHADGTVVALGPGKPIALAFAPDGERLATAGPGNLVRTWDYRGMCLEEAIIPAAARALTYTPDGRSLLVLDARGGISVLDPLTLASMGGWAIEGPANNLACSPDSQAVAVACGSWRDAEIGWVECWSIPLQRKVRCYRASGPVGAARFSPDGQTLVTGGWNGMIAWRTLPEGNLLAERQYPKDMVAAAAFSPDAWDLPFRPPPEPMGPPVPESPRTLELFRGFSQLPGP